MTTTQTEIAATLRLDDDPSPAANVLRHAMRAYEDAPRCWYYERSVGGIVKLDPSDDRDARELSLGVKFRAVTPTGAAVLMAWQRARAEVVHATAVRRREMGA